MHIVQHVMYAISTVCQIFVQEHSIENSKKLINPLGIKGCSGDELASGSGIMNIITGGIPRHQQQSQQQWKRQQVWTTSMHNALHEMLFTTYLLPAGGTQSPSNARCTQLYHAPKPVCQTTIAE